MRRKRFRSELNLDHSLCAGKTAPVIEGTREFFYELDKLGTKNDVVRCGNVMKQCDSIEEANLDDDWQRNYSTCMRTEEECFFQTEQY